MGRPRLLVLSAGNKIPLITSLVRHVDADVIAGDSDDACVAKEVFRFLKTPRRNSRPEDWACFFEENSITHALPTADADLSLFRAGSVSNTTILVSPLATTNTCADKLLFSRAVHGAAPTSPYLESGWFKKPRYQAGDKSGVVTQYPLIQPEWSIDVYRSRDGSVCHALARVRTSVHNGEATNTTIPYPRYKELEDMAKRAAHQLEIWGHAVFQAMHDDNGLPWFIECNCRVGGCSTLAFEYGMNSIQWMIDETLGRVPASLITPLRRPMTLLRCKTDVVCK